MVEVGRSSADCPVQVPAQGTVRWRGLPGILSSFEYVQGWTLPNLPHNLFQCWTTLTIFFLIIIMFKFNFLCLNLYPIPLVLSLAIRKYKSITFRQMLRFYGVKQVKLLLFLLRSFGFFATIL